MKNEKSFVPNATAVTHDVVRPADKIVATGVRRERKPRTRGLTMVIDKGLGLSETNDLLQMAADHIDFYKLGFGTTLLYEPDVLKRKLRAITEHGVAVLPGGTLFEIAVHEGTVPEFLSMACNVGFTHVEVSDGTIDVPQPLRRELIARATELGFGVLSEIGKKDPTKPLHPEYVIEQAMADIAAGAIKVIIEARDSGSHVGVYDEEGRLRHRLFEDIVARLSSQDDIIWEAPRSSQQQALLVKLGPHVNVGNVQPADVVALEAMRLGLRGDTLRLRLHGDEAWR